MDRFGLGYDDDENIIKFQEYDKKNDNQEEYIDKRTNYDEQIEYADNIDEKIRQKVRRDKLKKLRFFLLMLLFLIAFVAIIIFYINTKGYSHFNIKYSRIKSEVIAKYLPLKEGFLRYGNDGAIFIDKNGRELLNEGYYMKNPIVDFSGKYVAIADFSGNLCCLFDDTKKIASINSELPIKNVQVSDNGIIMLVSEDDSGTFINFFDKNAEILAQSRYPLNKKRFPTCFDLYKDGLKSAIVFLHYDDSAIISEVAILGFDKLSMNKPNNVIFSYSLKDEYVISAKYNSAGDLLLLSDRGIKILKNDRKISIKAKIDFEKMPKSVLYNDKFIAYVIKDDNMYKAYFYDYMGRKKSEIKIDMQYQNIVLNNDMILLTSDNEMRAYNYKGNLRFYKVVSDNINDIKAMGRLTYLVVYDDKLEVIELKR